MTSNEVSASTDGGKEQSGGGGKQFLEPLPGPTN